MMSSIAKCLTLVIALVCSSQATAHEVRPALLTLTQTSETHYDVSFKQPQVQGRFLNLSIETNCEQTRLDARTSAAALLETFTLNCPEPLAHIKIAGLEKTLIDTMITVERQNGSQDNYLVNGRDPVVDTTRGASTPVYFVLGIEHLFFGIDHVLFVLLLLYLVNGFMNLVKVITSFTVAHSITLGLSAFDIVTVSQGPVEALIALSIVMLAAEALHDRKSLIHEQPWLITFIFGLLHGLGFAGALAEIGLPEATAVLALLLFNIGIEVGQLVIIAIALGVTYSLQKLIIIPVRVAVLPVYLVGGLSTYWFIDRSLMVLGWA